MTAFLKIDDCKACHRAIPWEWAPAVLVRGSPLAGTGVWRSQLVDRRCPACTAALEAKRQEERRVLGLRKELIEVLGGQKPYREFTFERYQMTPENRLAYERSKDFNPASENLYLWGPCGVGKTHLAYAAARRCFEETLSAVIVWAPHLSRQVRMKDPEQEQAAMDRLTGAEALILDDLGAGSDTPFNRQLLQELLDARDFHDRGGLIVTSKYSLDALAEKLNEDTIPSRLAGMCRIIQITGQDHRPRRQTRFPAERHYE
jgi:DNA replication protein DnaC